MKKQDSNAKIKIIPLGGMEQIGMNITAFEYEDSIIVVDCGLAFPSDDMLGIDLVIPDVTYLKQNIDKVKGFVITHGHEDHIGALPYILKEVNVPVYGTKLTIALIENKLKEHNLLKNTKRKVIKHGQSINLGCFRIEFIKTNHSIADASALAIYSPAGVILHTGDFKIDYTPVFGEPADLERFAELGKKGVLALMCDSTNAIRPGFTPSEKTVGKTFDNIFADHKFNRIIVASFASNVDRVQQVINSAAKYGRKVVVEGRSMVNVIGTASELGYIDIPEGTLIDIDQLKNYPDEQTVLITTGSQGESMAALSRMAGSTHKKVSIKPTDVVVLSSTPIPGHEGRRSHQSGYARFRTCMSGRDQTDLCAGASEICDSGAWRVPPSDGSEESGTGYGNSEGQHRYHVLRGCGGTGTGVLGHRGPRPVRRNPGRRTGGRRRRQYRAA